MQREPSSDKLLGALLKSVSYARGEAATGWPVRLNFRDRSDCEEFIAAYIAAKGGTDPFGQIYGSSSGIVNIFTLYGGKGAEVRYVEPIPSFGSGPSPEELVEAGIDYDASRDRILTNITNGLCSASMSGIEWYPKAWADLTEAEQREYAVMLKRNAERDGKEPRG